MESDHGRERREIVLGLLLAATFTLIVAGGAALIIIAAHRSAC